MRELLRDAIAQPPAGTAANVEPLIVFVDDDLVVIDKPAGLLAVPGRHAPDCAWARVAARFDDAQIVHRLDQATSGLMVFARGAVAQRALSMAFAARQIDKHYEAVVHGLPLQDSGLIDAALAADWPRRPRQKIDPVAGKPSLTAWRVVQRDATAQRSRLALQPLTGRSHQLRVHLASIGHAIVGDALYGGPPDAQQPRLLLHATRLAFAHPRHGTLVSFDAPAAF